MAVIDTDIQSPATLQQQIEATYDVSVAGFFPNCDEMMELASSDLFCLRYPDHPLSHKFHALAQQVLA